MENTLRLNVTFRFVMVNMQLKEWAPLLGFKKTEWRQEGFPERPVLSPYFKKGCFLYVRGVNFPSLEMYKLTVNQVEFRVPVARNKITERTVEGSSNSEE